MTFLDRFFQTILLRKQQTSASSAGPVLQPTEDTAFEATKTGTANFLDPDRPKLDPWKGSVTVKPLSDKDYELTGSLESQLIEASGIDPKLFKPTWLNPDLDLEPLLPELKQRRIIDASGDSSLSEVFEDGALKISFDPNDYRHLTEISIDRFGRRSTQLIGVNAHVTAKDLETGEVILNGLMELVENDFERVGHAGLARINFHETQEFIMESISESETEEEKSQIERVPDSNIIKVKFGREQ